MTFPRESARHRDRELSSHLYLLTRNSGRRLQSSIEKFLFQHVRGGLRQILVPCVQKLSHAGWVRVVHPLHDEPAILCTNTSSIRMKCRTDTPQSGPQNDKTIAHHTQAEHRINRTKKEKKKSTNMNKNKSGVAALYFLVVVALIVVAFGPVQGAAASVSSRRRRRVLLRRRSPFPRRYWAAPLERVNATVLQQQRWRRRRRGRRGRGRRRLFASQFSDAVDWVKGAASESWGVWV